MATMQSRNRNRGKNGERRYAKLFAFLGAKRVGLHGDEDVQIKGFSAETKVVAKCVLRKWMEQCVRNNLLSNGKDTKKMPMVGVCLKSSSKWMTIMWTADVIKILKQNIKMKEELKKYRERIHDHIERGR